MDVVPGCFLLGGWFLRCGIQVSAGTARSQFFTSVESFKDLSKLGLYILKLKVLFIQQGAALFAVPEQAVLFMGQAFAFNDQSDSVWQALG